MPNLTLLAGVLGLLVSLVPVGCGGASDALIGGPAGSDAGACTSDSQCGSGKADGSSCNTTLGVCAECASNADCNGGAVCSPTTGRCSDVNAGCSSDAQCPADAPRCDTGHQQCVGCLSDQDCPSSAPHCDGNRCQT
jgi:hypothetical protein